MSEQQSIGMMQGAFFVPKTDLLNWINNLMKLNLTRIQQLGTGAVYCQIIDIMFPGKVNIGKVNWKARNQWQFLNNLKILQQSFAKCKIHKHIQIERLSKSKYQDNLQFIQWLKRYFDLYNKNDISTYDPITARKNAQTDFSFLDLREPHIKRDKEQIRLARSKSPYDQVKHKIQNRSATLEKHNVDKSKMYMNKLCQIKEILNKNSKESQKLQKIQSILQQIKEQFQNSSTLEIPQSQVQNIQKIPSKNTLVQKKIKKKQ